MNTLEFIGREFTVNIHQFHQPVEIPNTTRIDFALLLNNLGFNHGVEVGVERGLYSEVLLKAIPDLHLYSIDAWTAYSGYRDHLLQSQMDKLYQEATDRLTPYKNRNYIIKAFSVDAAKQFPEEHFDFVYLDGNHAFKQVIDDIYAWYPKVKVGGILAGHDYIKRRDQRYMMDVIPAVNTFVGVMGIKPLFVLGRKAKIEGEARESVRSWFIVKQ